MRLDWAWRGRISVVWCFGSRGGWPVLAERSEPDAGTPFPGVGSAGCRGRGRFRRFRSVVLVDDLFELFQGGAGMRLLQRNGSIGLTVRVGRILPHGQRTRRGVGSAQRGRRWTSGSDEWRRGRRRGIHLNVTGHGRISFVLAGCRTVASAFRRADGPHAGGYRWFDAGVARGVAGSRRSSRRWSSSWNASSGSKCRSWSWMDASGRGGGGGWLSFQDLDQGADGWSARIAAPAAPFQRFRRSVEQLWCGLAVRKQWQRPRARRNPRSGALRHAGTFLPVLLCSS